MKESTPTILIFSGSLISRLANGVHTTYTRNKADGCFCQCLSQLLGYALALFHRIRSAGSGLVVGIRCIRIVWPPWILCPEDDIQVILVCIVGRFVFSFLAGTVAALIVAYAERLIGSTIGGDIRNHERIDADGIVQILIIRHEMITQFPGCLQPDITESRIAEVVVEVELHINRPLSIGDHEDKWHVISGCIRVIAIGDSKTLPLVP